MILSIFSCDPRKQSGFQGKKHVEDLHHHVIYKNKIGNEPDVWAKTDNGRDIHTPNEKKGTDDWFSIISLLLSIYINVHIQIYKE